MDWLAQVDGYCERTDFSFWSEPLNAVTNAAFIIAALVMWRRSAGLPTARLLCAIVFAIGLGSFLFHTHATVWAALADVAPIGLFILTYLFLTNRDLVGMPWWAAMAVTGLFAPFAYVKVLFLNQIPFFNISNFYWTVPILLIGYGTYLRGTVGKGFLIGAGILCVSITLRS
ncbi:MAG: ceramidase domain-containing protein, partial [Pseudomonadota bacterium]